LLNSSQQCVPIAFAWDYESLGDLQISILLHNSVLTLLVFGKILVNLVVMK